MDNIALRDCSLPLGLPEIKWRKDRCQRGAREWAGVEKRKSRYFLGSASFPLDVFGRDIGEREIHIDI